MKLVSNTLLSNLSLSELSNLKYQVRERLDVRFAQKKNKVFTAADLWNIHQQKRSFKKRSYIL